MVGLRSEGIHLLYHARKGWILSVLNGLGVAWKDILSLEQGHAQNQFAPCVLTVGIPTHGVVKKEEEEGGQGGELRDKGTGVNGIHTASIQVVRWFFRLVRTEGAAAETEQQFSSRLGCPFTP